MNPVICDMVPDAATLRTALKNGVRSNNVTSSTFVYADTPNHSEMPAGGNQLSASLLEDMLHGSAADSMDEISVNQLPLPKFNVLHDIQVFCNNNNNNDQTYYQQPIMRPQQQTSPIKYNGHVVCRDPRDGVPGSTPVLSGDDIKVELNDESNPFIGMEYAYDPIETSTVNSGSHLEFEQVDMNKYMSMFDTKI